MIDRCYIEITNTCNLNCDFCPKHHRRKRQLSAEEFNLITDKVRGKVCFLYFHLMGEPLLHPLLPQFVSPANSFAPVPFLVLGLTYVVFSTVWTLVLVMASAPLSGWLSSRESAGRMTGVLSGLVYMALGAMVFATKS